MDLPICEHIKMGGARCGSPAERDQKYCHYHAGVHRLVPKTNLFVNLYSPVAQLIPQHECNLPYLEDSASIQIGFTQLIHGVSQDRIQPRQARLILEALKGAAANLKHTDRLMVKAAELAARRKPPASVKTAGAKPSSARSAKAKG